MEITTIYAIAAGGIVSVFIFIRCLYLLAPLQSTVSVFVSRHLTYPYCLGRHRFAGPWTRAGVLVHISYLAVNLVCLLLSAPSVSDIGGRAGVLSVVNMTFLFTGPHLSLLADILGVSLHTCRKIHGSMAWMSVLLLAIHVVIALLIGRVAFPLRDAANLIAAIVGHLL